MKHPAIQFRPAMFIGERNKAAWRRVAKLCDWIQRGRDNPTQPIRPAM